MPMKCPFCGSNKLEETANFNEFSCKLCNCEFRDEKPGYTTFEEGKYENFCENVADCVLQEASGGITHVINAIAKEAALAGIEYIDIPIERLQDLYESVKNESSLGIIDSFDLEYIKEGMNRFIVLGENILKRTDLEINMERFSYLKENQLATVSVKPLGPIGGGKKKEVVAGSVEEENSLTDRKDDVSTQDGWSDIDTSDMHNWVSIIGDVAFKVYDKITDPDRKMTADEARDLIRQEAIKMGVNKDKVDYEFIDKVIKRIKSSSYEEFGPGRLDWLDDRSIKETSNYSEDVPVTNDIVDDETIEAIADDSLDELKSLYSDNPEGTFDFEMQYIIDVAKKYWPEIETYSPETLDKIKTVLDQKANAGSNQDFTVNGPMEETPNYSGSAEMSHLSSVGSDEDPNSPEAQGIEGDSEFYDDKIGGVSDFASDIKEPKNPIDIDSAVTIIKSEGLSDDLEIYKRLLELVGNISGEEADKVIDAIRGTSVGVQEDSLTGTGIGDGTNDIAVSEEESVVTPEFAGDSDEVDNKLMESIEYIISKANIVEELRDL